MSKLILSTYMAIQRQSSSFQTKETILDSCRGVSLSSYYSVLSPGQTAKQNH